MSLSELVMEEEATRLWRMGMAASQRGKGSTAQCIGALGMDCGVGYILCVDRCNTRVPACVHEVESALLFVLRVSLRERLRQWKGGFSPPSTLDMCVVSTVEWHGVLWVWA